MAVPDPSPAATQQAAESVEVTGSVFHDADSDGVRGPEESGVAGVVVSDGVNIVTTDEQGWYRLTVDTERRLTDLVFVTVPAGWAAPTDEHRQPQFSRRVEPDAHDTAQADFPLRPDPAGRDAFYRFVTLADTHVEAGTVNNRERFTAQVADINELVANAALTENARRYTPRFLIVAGDTTNTATFAQFDDYLAGTATSLVPVWTAIGNHEYRPAPTYRERVDNYRQKIGPEWYSFDYGDNHYVVLDLMDGLRQAGQLSWLEQDLTLSGEGKQIIVVIHAPLNTTQTYHPDLLPPYIELLERYDTTLVLAGHTHSNDVAEDVIDGALHVVTNSASYTIDQTPNGFRVVDLDDGLVDVPFREFDRPRSLTLVHPAPGARLRPAPTTAQINAYHTASDVASARYRVDGGAWQEMRASGARTWSAPLDASGLAVGEHTFEADVTEPSGLKRSESGVFTVVARRDKAPSPPHPGAPWRMFHHDAAHSGVARNVVAPPLGLAWSHRTGGTILTSSPAVAGGIAYISVRDENGTEHTSILAVDTATGEQRWRFPVDAQIEASPAVVGNTVLAGTVRGTLYALDARTGARRWAQSLPPTESPLAFMYFSPTVSGDVVYQAINLDEGLHVFALDLDTGAVRWRTREPFGSSWISHGTPAVGGGMVYVAGTFGQITALDADTGEFRWRAQPAGGWTRSAMVYADGLVLHAFENDVLVALDAATGEERWRYRSDDVSYLFGNGTAAMPAVAYGVVYAGFADGNVTALRLETGDPLWSQRTGGGVISSPAVSGDTVYVGSNDGHVYGLDRRTGQPLWRFEIGTWVASSPAVTGNAVVVGAWDGNVYAFTPSGAETEPRWTLISGQITDAATGEPVAGARIIATDADGDKVGDLRADADGTYELGLPPGDYELLVVRRGYLASEPIAVEVADFGQELTVDATLTPISEPTAGASDAPLDYGRGSPHPDVPSGEAYHFVANPHVQAVISSLVGPNNAAGTFAAGWIGDVFLLDDRGLETLDWSEYVLTTAEPGDPSWNRPGEWLPLPNITVDGDTVVASGTANVDSDIAARMTYETLTDAPAVKLTLELTNTGMDDFDGSFHYNLDPDTPGGDTAIVSGVGSNPGYVHSGWTSNFVYGGPTDARNGPAHAIAWATEEPVVLSAHGFIFGAWFDAFVPAGGSRTISWYHVTDYPSEGLDPTATVGRWAANIDLLDPDVPDRSRITGTVTDAESGEPLGGATVQAVAGDGTVVGSSGTLADGSYVIPIDPGSYTVRASRLAYATVTAPVTVGTSTTVEADLALNPVTVAAGTGFVVPGPQSEGATDDIVMQNRRFAMTVAKVTDDPQLPGVTAGKPIDAAVHGLGDELDWMNLPWVSTERPSGTEAWQVLGVRSDQVEVTDVTGESATVRATGAATAVEDLDVVTDYTITPDTDWVTARSVFSNQGVEPLTVWLGDVIDVDATRQRSAVAGHGVIATGFADPQPFEPDGAWIAMAGDQPQVYGLIYELPDFTAYGNGQWIQSQQQATIQPGASFTLDRRIVVAPTDEADDPFDVVAELAATEAD